MMYIDLATQKICSKEFLLRKNSMVKARGVDLSAYDLQEMNAAALVESTGDVATGSYTLADDIYTREYRGFTTAEILVQEKQWVLEELGNADIEVRKHDDTHGRVVGTKPAWRTYRNALRDHVIADVVQGERPVRPA